MSDSDPSTTPWLTTDEAAEYLRVTRSTLYRWAAEGCLKYFESPGGHRRYRVEDCDAALAQVGGVAQ